jgi:hypothetical protein
MRKHRFCQLAYALCLCAATISAHASTVKSPTAQQCEVEQDRPAQRIFADPDGKHGWSEYRRVKGCA